MTNESFYAQLYEAQLANPDSISWMSLLVVLLILLQTFLIIGLQRSRLNNKRARKALAESQVALEERILERTESLHTTNNLLIDEVARHEQTGRQLRETKLYLQSMINSMPSIIIGVTATGEITHWNAAAENTFEIFSNEALGKKVMELLPRFPFAQSTIDSTIRKGEPYSVQYAQLNNQHNTHFESAKSTENASTAPDDLTASNEIKTNEDSGVHNITTAHNTPITQEKKQYFDITIYPLISSLHQGVVIRMDDVTLKVTIENLMIQNEKMFSLGEVAAGIAHEINNPLSVILQNVQNILRRTDSSFQTNQSTAGNLQVDFKDVQRYLEVRDIPQMINSIREAGERAANIVRNMLEFSHNSQRKTSLIDIRHLIEQTISLNQSIDQASSEKVDLIVEFSDSLPLIHASAPELQQVILNLLRNAKQALLHCVSPKPCIWVRVYVRERHLMIEIQDNGPGMTDDVSQHIFEPFFTTKESGSGTGLGLSVSYFIITERHQGSIDVETAPFKGCKFTIKLPIE